MGTELTASFLLPKTIGKGRKNIASKIKVFWKRVLEQCIPFEFQWVLSHLTEIIFYRMMWNGHNTSLDTSRTSKKFCAHILSSMIEFYNISWIMCYTWQSAVENYITPLFKTQWRIYKTTSYGKVFQLLQIMLRFNYIF